jgi:putative ABC transport system permease protein
LNRLNTLFFDAASKPDFGDVATQFTEQSPLIAEVSGKQMEVIGLFKVGVSFGADGNVIMSDQSLFELHPHRQPGIIDIGLINIDPEAKPAEVVQRIQKGLPEHLQAMTMMDYKAYEKNFWAKRTPIGFIFGLGTLMGFIVGAVIVYQILYTDVNDHLSEYATLKAMGYDDAYLSSIVIKEAIILAVMGYLPGWAIASGMLALTRYATQLPSSMTASRSVMVLCLTIGMCAGAGLLAMRKLRSADPADIF